MPTRHFLNIEYESDAGGEVALQMIEEMKRRPNVKIVGIITWVTVIASTPPATPPVIQPTSQKWKVTVQTWNIRSRPSMLDNVEIVGQLKLGEIVSQLEENEYWVRHDGGDLKRAGWSGKRGLARA